jgi:L-asparaginase II
MAGWHSSPRHFLNANATAVPLLNVETRHAPLSVSTRNGAVESVHYGSVAVVDRDGALLHAAGDPDCLTFTRSALKPLQAMPFVAAGGVDRYGLTSVELAVICASHAGEPRHVDAVGKILACAGNSPDDLQCGTHPPGFYDARGDVPPPPPYSPLQHNCSGKHSGMLAYCAMCGWTKRDYLAFDHPLQQAVRASVAHFTGIAEDMLVDGIDGCSAPNYAVPLRSLARAFARLADPSADRIFNDAPQRIARAMTAHPEMVSGAFRNDLAYMQAGRGDWVTKIGAEGVQAIGVASLGIGIAVKIADGAKRGLHPAVVETLDQLGLLDESQRQALSVWRQPSIRNYRGIVTGDVRPVVVLDKR